MEQTEFEPKIQFFQTHQKKQVKTGNKLTGFILNVLLLVISGFFIYNIGKSVFITGEKMKILANARQEVDDLRLKNLELLLETERVNSDDYIETQARDKLNYSKEGETIFIIPDNLLEEAMDQGEAVEGVSTRASEINVLIWLQFFLTGT